MGLFKRNSAKNLQPGAQAATAPPPPQTPRPDPNTGPLRAANSSQPNLQTYNGGSELNLVNYSPTEIMQQVEQRLANVHFGMNGRQAFKEWAGEVWDIAAPLVLLAGTAGEVFFFIWNNTTGTAAWWVALSVLATVVVLEATFAVCSYKSSTLRNRADRRPGGKTAQDKAILRRYRTMWFVMGAGVAVGQAAFLISAMGTKLTNVGLLIAFAGVRPIFTLAADFYTAFIHAEKPTSGEEASREIAERATVAEDLLKQTNRQIKIINDGILDLERIHAQAAMDRSNTETELAMTKMENETRIQNHRTMQEQADTMNRLGQGLLRAIFDPTMPHDQRQAMLGSLESLVNMTKMIPPAKRTIQEED